MGHCPMSPSGGTYVFTALMVALLGFVAAQAAPPRQTVLKGATVITAAGTPPIRDAVVVIDGETIRSVGGKDTGYPADATVIEVPGKFIIPGLVESHAHYEAWMGELFLNHGVTTVLAVGGDFGTAKEASQASTSRSPRIFDTAGDPDIDPSMSEEQVREAVRAWLEGQPDFARLRDYTEQSSGTFRWAAEEIHGAGLIVFGHTMNAPESVRAGHDVVEHMWGFIVPLMSPQEQEAFKAGRHLHWSLFLKDWSKLEQSMQEAIAQGASINPTLVYELGSLSSHAAKHEREIYELHNDRSLMVYYPQNIAASLLQKQRQIRNFAGRYENLVLLSRLTPDERRALERGYASAGRLVERFVALGGKIQAGTDTISGGTPGLSLHHEMELLVEAGLTPSQALQSTTAWSAEMLAGKNGALGHPNVGVIAEDMLADLVVLAADPLQDIGNTRTIERVMKGGRFVTLGYDPAYYSFSRPPRSIAMATPEPELSAIMPHTIVEGSTDFELIVHGVGFVGNSVVRVDGASMRTTFVNPRMLKAKIPASVVKRATRNPFDAPGPDQHSGVFGDPTVSVTVFNAPPEGGESNSISLRLRPQWLGVSDDTSFRNAWGNDFGAVTRERVTAPLLAIGRAPMTTGAPEAGWYSDDQATRGRALYLKHCAECHGADFVPDDFSPGLTGAAFDWQWKSRTVYDLFETIRTTMPPGRGGTLGRRTTIDIVAYLLRMNEFPDGAAELPPTPKLLQQMRLQR